MTDASPEPPTKWYKPWTLQVPPWLRALFTFCLIVLIVALCYEGYRRADRYAHKAVVRQLEQIPVGVVLKNTPAWLNADILTSIRRETEELARRDAETFKRFQNPLDQDILREIADNYTSHDLNGVNRQAMGSNAWIKRILHVQRSVQSDKKAQWIEIYADYRKPAAVVATGWQADGSVITDPATLQDPRDDAKVPVLKFGLIDDEQTQLPGEYTSNVFHAMGLQVLYGIAQKPPVPGDTWGAPEVADGLKLAHMLERQPYAAQIAMINLSNYRARIPAMQLQPQIVLETIYNTRVWWGRPVGDEGFREIQTAAKFKALAAIFTRFGRIDAGKDYVDIRLEQVKIPATATP